MSNDLANRHQTAAPGSGAGRGNEWASAPGKRSLVEQAHLPAVQRHGGGEPPQEAVHAAAARGVATPASSLPFSDTIRRAFGRHDVSSVQAHAGAEAAQTTRTMGADAYAAGDHVVLGKADLHTVAHEAAHVVQQRSGVQLKGGVGQAGDVYEQHADAVADKVVAGQSAEALLSEMAGPGGTTGAVQQQAVQRTAETTPQSDDGAQQEQSEHGEHESGDGQHDEASRDLQGAEPAASGTETATAAAQGNAAPAAAVPVQRKAASSSRGRALGAVLLKRATGGKRAGGYRAAPSLAAVRAGTASIQRGMSGSSVRFVQQHVHADADGLFGPQTLAAVKAFQRAHHLEVDGVVGSHTMATIDHGGGTHAAGDGTHAAGGGAPHDNGSHPSGGEAQIREQVITKARSHMGARYSWAADGPSMFDCSGFAWYVLHTDMHLTSAGRTTAAGLSHAPYTTSTSSPEKGDLVFYSSGGISHVTIALGQGSEVIGASGGGSHTHGQDPNARVKVTNWNNDRRHKSFGSIRGLINRRSGR